MPKHQLRLLAEVVVYKLYEAHIDDDMLDRHSLEDIYAMFSVPVSKKLLESSIAYMGKDRSPSLISRSGVAGNYMFRISSHGILFAEQQLLDKNSLLSYFAAQGDGSLGEVAGFDAIFRIDDGPRVLEAWTPLNLDRDTAEYNDFIASLDECIEAVRGSNEFSNEFPVERENVLASLEEGRKEIGREGSIIYKSKLHRYFVDPLRWIGAALGKSALSAIANATIQKLITLVNTLI